MNVSRIVVSIVVLFVWAGALAGCSKKEVVAEPSPPPATTPAETPPATPPATEPPPEAPSEGAVQFEDVFYDFDSSVLTASAQTTLDKNGKTLQDNSSAKVTIEGHCDERGTVEYNLALGDRRAAAAKDYLTRYGIAADRLATISYGEERPFAQGHDEAAWAQNRRAHFATR